VEKRGKWIGEEITSVDIARKLGHYDVVLLLESYRTNPAQCVTDNRKELKINGKNQRLLELSGGERKTCSKGLH